MNVVPNGPRQNFFAIGKTMMNETLMTLETRRSCRKFKPDMITDEELEAVLRAGTFAPSGKNQQSSIIIAVTNKEMRDQIAEENRKIGGWDEGFDPFYGAPVILIVIADKDANNGSGTYINDGSLVMGNLMNAAASLGLGSVWIHRAKQEFESEFGKSILEKLGIKGNYEGIGHVALGYRQTPVPQALARKENYIFYIK
ncbi:Nitroreductase [Fibrobacter sp. UWH6]|nr:Nitroreductase [Fibrobacter sp. UWH6]